MVPITRYAWHCAIVIIESYKKAFTLHYIKKKLFIENIHDRNRFLHTIYSSISIGTHLPYASI